MEFWTIDDASSYNAFNEHIKNHKITSVNKEKFTVSTMNDTFMIVPKYWFYLAKTLNTIQTSVENSNEVNDIVFGKNKEENIVSIDFKDNIIYLHKKDGTVTEEPFLPYIVTTYSISKESKRLEGNNALRYLTPFPNVQAIIPVLGMGIGGVAPAFSVSNCPSARADNRGPQPNWIIAGVFGRPVAGGQHGSATATGGAVVVYGGHWL